MSLAPAKFRFSFHDAWMVPHFAVEWLPGDECLKVTQHHGKERYVEVSEARWQDFWKKLHAVGAWEWPGDHERPMGEIVSAVLDGDGWILEVEHGGRVLRTGGMNAFPAGPDDHDNTEPTALFHKLTRAVESLVA